MTAAKSGPPWQRALITQSIVTTAAIILALLYWARSIIIPVAMALFFSYVLAPVVRFLTRHGFGRHASVLVTVAFATLVVIGTSFVITKQIAGLTQTLTDKDNRDHIKQRITDVRNRLAGSGGPGFQGALDDIMHSFDDETSSDPQKVVLESSRPRWMTNIDSLIGPVTEAFGMAAFSFILVVFILLAREDLKDRLLRLTGDTTVSSTTRAMDDATTRLSQYLLAQLTLNVAFGLVIMLGVWLMGLKYVLLWGFIATLMRYVPYIGTWIGVIFPTLFSLATSDTWFQPIGVIALYAVLELVVGNVIEPVLYGAKLGVSEVAQLISAAFWSFLWGPIGLILSGPIATCLVVLGRHSPRFQFFEILLGTEPPLAADVALFQRFLSGDTDEAVRLVEKNTSAEDPTAVCDTLLIPTLKQLKIGLHAGEFSGDEQRELIGVAREVVTHTLESLPRPAPAAGGAGEPGRLLLIPARDAADQIAIDLFVGLLPSGKWEIETASVDTLASELVEQVAERHVDAVCIGSLPPSGLVQVRYLCKRLRQHNSDVRILVARWGDTLTPEQIAELTGVGATTVDVTLKESLANLSSWRSLVSGESTPGQNSSAAGTKSASVPLVVS